MHNASVGSCKKALLSMGTYGVILWLMVSEERGLDFLLECVHFLLDNLTQGTVCPFVPYSPITKHPYYGLSTCIPSSLPMLQLEVYRIRNWV